MSQTHELEPSETAGEGMGSVPCSASVAASTLGFVPPPLTTMAFDLSTPINTALLLYILYTVQRILIPSNKLPKTIPTEFKHGYSWMPKAHPPTLLFQTYTPKTLEPFNGENGQRILLAIKGIVYDVTAGRNFYGPSELSFPSEWSGSVLKGR